MSSDNYTNYLRSLKPFSFQTIKHPPKGSLGSPTIVSNVFPPLNTDIRFSSVAPYQPTRAVKGLMALGKPLPEIWDWAHDYSVDSDNIKNKKRLIGAPGNQEKCGSCWAFSSASIISDLFVVAGLVQSNPKLSTTYSLSCYPQGKCDGGNPADLLDTISKSGLATENCVDYSWCDNNENCNVAGVKHLDPNSVINVNSLLPSCGCYFPSGVDHKLYTVKNLSRVSSDYEESSLLLKSINIVKNHIFAHGPVLGAFHVYQNFLGGHYKETNGIYIDTIDYDNNNGQNIVKGNHAVAIMGWGVDKNVPGFGVVPYWYVRNSWGDWGGDGGYFKMAMYPINKRSEFIQTVEIDDPGAAPFKLGGILVFEADQIIDSNGNALNQITPFNGKNDQSFYKSDSNLMNKPIPQPNGNKSTPHPTPQLTPQPTPQPNGNKSTPQPNGNKSTSIEILSLNSFFILQVIVSLICIGLVYGRS